MILRCFSFIIGFGLMAQTIISNGSGLLILFGFLFLVGGFQKKTAFTLNDLFLSSKIKELSSFILDLARAGCFYFWGNVV